MSGNTWPMLGGKQLCIAATALAVITVFLAQVLRRNHPRGSDFAGRNLGG
jgi:hypothetical protein